MERSIEGAEICYRTPEGVEYWEGECDYCDELTWIRYYSHADSNICGDCFDTAEMEL